MAMNALGTIGFPILTMVMPSNMNIRRMNKYVLRSGCDNFNNYPSFTAGSAMIYVTAVISRPTIAFFSIAGAPLRR